jgi:hypothetical protein
MLYLILSNFIFQRERILGDFMLTLKMMKAVNIWGFVNSIVWFVEICQTPFDKIDLSSTWRPWKSCLLKEVADIVVLVKSSEVVWIHLVTLRPLFTIEFQERCIWIKLGKSMVTFWSKASEVHRHTRILFDNQSGLHMTNRRKSESHRYETFSWYIYEPNTSHCNNSLSAALTAHMYVDDSFTSHTVLFSFSESL